MENYIMIYDIINDKIKDKIKEEIDINKLKVNDYIYINFSPDSQKYIYELVPKLGIITNINNDNITILNYNGITTDLLYENCCSDYGQSLGYAYYIYLIKN
jgi:hypothetical protein